MKTAKQIKKSYRTVEYWRQGLQKAAWREIAEHAHEIGNPEQREADEKLRYKVECAVSDVGRDLENYFGPKIGKAEMQEIRTKIR